MTKNKTKITAEPESVDDYLAALPDDKRAALEKLHRTIKAVVPEAVEVISYQIPTFKHRGPLVAMAAFSDHCSFYVMSTPVMDAHRDELGPYDMAKATIRFQSDRPLPAALVKKLVKARIRENESGASS